MTSQITGLYLGILGSFYFMLSMYVVRCRWKFRVGIGDGEQHVLQKAIRIHGNFIEYVPIILLIMLVLESSGAPTWRIHTLGLTIVIARLAHAAGIYKTSKVSPPRAVGVIGTFGALLLGSIWLLWSRLGATGL